MFKLGDQGIANRMSIITLFVIVIGVFVLVKYSQINEKLVSLQNDAQHFVKNAKQNTNEELRDIQQLAQQTVQQTEQRLNRAFDSYRRKLLEIDNNNKAVRKEWDKEFTDVLADLEDRMVLKEQELDKLITAYQSKLENVDELPDTPVTESSDLNEIEEFQKAGDQLADQQLYSDAILQYKKAVDLLLEKYPQRKKLIASLYAQISESNLNIYMHNTGDNPDSEALEQTKKYASLAITEDNTNARAPYLLARVLNEYEEGSDDIFEYLAKALDNNGATLEMVLNDFPNMEKDERFQDFIEAYRKNSEL